MSTSQSRGQRINPWSGKTAYPPEQLSPVPQLPHPHTATSEVCTLQQEKSLRSEAHAPQERVAQAPESTERLPLQGRPSQKYIHSLKKNKTHTHTKQSPLKSVWEALAFARADAEGPLWGSVLRATSPRAAQQAEGRGGRSTQGQGAGVDPLAFHFPPPELPRESLPAGHPTSNPPLGLELPALQWRPRSSGAWLRRNL